ncbi:MAG: S46 family peptidase [Chitinophagaceae bacterium]|nr:S46 family peptidase [Chitinophagaceae bacterium]
MKLLKYVLVICFVFISAVGRADEGMWLPQLLAKLNESHMKSLGMKISASDIYSVNKGSLKDAIVSFGGFCTGEVISDKGLVLTNHHCGFGSIQDHSTLDHNYIRDGFWAKNHGEEIPNPGLFVTFIVRIEDVSNKVLAGVKDEMSENERQSQIDKNIAAIRKGVKKEDYQDSFIRGFFEGNQYFMFVTETYRDVRLVGAPPSAIGNFGKDTDNWIWPRHTGDFSMFRIYAGKDNKPAAYSPDNVPYVPKRSLAISMDGVKEGDFTMVFGFPGRTMEYLHSAAVDQTVRVNDPTKIAIRDKALAVIDGYMRKDEQIKIQYASKYAGISNAWKKWQGEVLGLTKTNAVAKKQAYEAEFQKRVNANAALKSKYGDLLQQLELAYKELEPLGLQRDYFNEVFSKIELFSISSQLNQAMNAQGKDNYETILKRTQDRLKGIYEEYNAEVDRKLFAALMEVFYQGLQDYKLPDSFTKLLKDAGGDFNKMAENIYAATTMDEEQKTLGALETDAKTRLEQHKTDVAANLFSDLLTYFSTTVSGQLNEAQDKINRLQRDYMKAQMEVFREKTFYPDANSTMRVTYGKAMSYEPRDAVKYEIYTYLDGVMEKYKPGDYEFDVPEKLRELYAKKDYGKYGANGKMPVCFIARNHTTGGNSGSPALDAYGNLIGLNFDRAWEGTMSDINYDPSICRNIMVDIRYILFIVDKYAGAGHLVKEMKLISKKK